MTANNTYSALRFVHPDFDSRPGEGGLTVSTLGQISVVDGEQSIRQSIGLLLSTVPGERVRRPGYGCELYRLLFSPNDETTHGLAMHYIQSAVTNWEPRVDVVRVDAYSDETRQNIMHAKLQYRLKRTQELEELSFSLDLSLQDY